MKKLRTGFFFSLLTGFLFTFLHTIPTASSETIAPIYNLLLRCSGTSFDSQFNAHSSCWDAQHGVWSIADNQWLTSTSSSTTPHWSSISHKGNYTNFNYSARLKRIASSGYSTALFVRGKSLPLDNFQIWNKAYHFQYQNDGLYSVWMVNSGNYTRLVQANSPAIVQGENWNELRVIANGSSFTFYINGTQVWTETDTSFASGEVGIAMYSEAIGDQLWVDWATLTIQ